MIKALNLHLVAEHAIEDCNEGNFQGDVFAFFYQLLDADHIEFSDFKCLKSLLLYLHFQHAVGITQDLVFICFNSFV
jgi:septin family protein